jgi:hypothetical protein
MMIMPMHNLDISEAIGIGTFLFTIEVIELYNNTIKGKTQRRGKSFERSFFVYLWRHAKLQIILNESEQLKEKAWKNV